MKKKRRKQSGKRRSVLLFSILVVILLIAGILMSRKYAIKQGEEEETEEFLEEETSQGEASQDETSQREEEETSQGETSQREEEEITAEQTAFIFVGESHMVVADDEYARNGSDIDGIEYGKNLFFVQTGLNGWMGTAEWLTSTETQDGEEGALLQIDNILAAHDFRKCYILIQHGSSMSQYQDLWSSYETIYKTYEERYQQCELYVIAVPPVQEEEFLAKTGVKRSNQSIQKFNEYTQGLLKQKQYLDYYDWFKDNGKYQDYIHFEGRTYKSLFTSIMGQFLS